VEDRLLIDDSTLNSLFTRSLEREYNGGGSGSARFFSGHPLPHLLGVAVRALALATGLGDFCGSFYSQTNETVLSCPQPRIIGETSRQQQKSLPASPVSICWLK
jgi:hypothetical protein